MHPNDLRRLDLLIFFTLHDVRRLPLFCNVAIVNLVYYGNKNHDPAPISKVGNDSNKPRSINFLGFIVVIGPCRLLNVIVSVPHAK
eukprot:5199242-Pyramimonas_sp.AAC.1